ncbi:autotransporter outer membrane beta-barrel domain-containing protein [Pseudomonas chlororaphis]|uniref:Outer membrane autotransporter barrel domain protein n=1 Tax=Pseudomonas chlororaphis O6 TaxID=1037915 RepID=A0AB33X0X7_9PSED|nr:autotransporter outer membrane beta-barrel domain-containing protein [Pseudomonas chlororaphis]EIM19039.1 outer membrane autotransporter barrel domain protein [Pseudomonas chlororaphis O6]
MNHAYRLIWNAAQSAWVVTSELAKRSKKSKGIICAAVCLISSLSQAGQVNVNGTSIDILPGTIIDTGTLSGASGGYAIVATNTGTITSDGLLTLKTGGGNAHAVFMQSGSTASLQNTMITTTGGGSHGLDAFNAGSLITIGNSAISTGGNTAFGVRAVGGGVINITDSNVSTAGNGSYGLNVTGAGSVVNAAGVTVATQGNIQAGTSAAGADAENGGRLQITNSTARATSITTSGSNAYGLLAQSGGELAAAGDTRAITVRTTGANAPGAWVVGTGSLMQLTNVDIQTSGIGSYGAAGVGAGNRLEINGGNVTSSGESSAGVVSNGSLVVIRPNASSQGTTVQTTGANSDGLIAYLGGKIDVDGMSIVTSGDASRGARAEYGGTLSLANSTITTAGLQGYGLSALGLDSSVNATNVNVVTTGGNVGAISANGIVAEFGASVTVNGASTVKTEGFSGMGLLSQVGGDSSEPETVLTFNGDGNASIFTLGDHAAGAAVCSRAVGASDCTDILSRDVSGEIGPRAVLNLGNADVSTQGASSFGLYTYGRGASLSAQNVAISTAGVNAHAAMVRNGGVLSASDSSLVSTGANAAGLFMTSPANVVGTAQLSNILIAATQGASIMVDDGAADITMLNSKAETNNGLWLSVAATDLVNPAVANLLVDRSIVTGAAITEPEATSNVTLSNGTVWSMSGSSNVSSLRNAASTISFAGPGLARSPGFKTLTVSGEYVGEGGLIEINTQLEGDDSLTDKLVINGNSSGNTSLQVNNANGKGAYTYNDGIQVVQVDGVSNGVFSLAGRVVAGSNEYLLFQGGKSNPDDGDWYLRSEVPVEPPVEPPIEPENPEPPVEPPVEPESPEPPVEPPVISPEGPNPGGSKPSLYRPEVGAYLGNQLAAIGMFQHTLHERVGELDFSEAQRGEDGTPGSVWMRVKRNDFTADTGSSQIDVQSTTDMIQVGADLVHWTDGDSRLHLGVMAGTGKAKTDVRSNVLGYKAKGEVEGYSVGVYGTWYQNAAQPTGAYVDSWLQFGDYDNSVKGDGLAREKYGSKTWAASVETGYAFEVGQGEGKAYYVEPQAQVIYTDYKADKHREANGTVVKSKNGKAVTTRLGARAYIRPTEKSGVRVQPFVAANLWRSSDDTSMSFNDTTHKLNTAKNVYEFKAGAEVDLGSGWSAWGHLGTQVAAGDQRDVSGQLGVKYSW